jgi:hypothetical protein
VKAGFAVVRPDGTMLAASSPTPLVPGADGTLSRSFGVPLEGAGEGRYELVVVAADEATGERVEARAAFAVSSSGAP